jgi:hypothetical protein
LARPAYLIVVKHRTALLTAALVLIKEESLQDHLSFISAISFLLIFLIHLIADWCGRSPGCERRWMLHPFLGE